jgi:hypothetical protein
MGAVSDRDEAEIVERLGRDVTATLGARHLDLVRDTARQIRQFEDERDAYIDRVVAEVQQHVHCGFIDTSWPACPAHPHHPMGFRAGWWVAHGQRVARLGEPTPAVE